MKFHGNRREMFRALAGAAALVAGLTAAGGSFAAEKSLLWVQPMRDHPVHRLMQAGFLAKCKELGYKINPENGHLSLPDAPGLGIDLNIEAIKAHPYDPNAYLNVHMKGWEKRLGTHAEGAG